LEYKSEGGVLPLCHPLQLYSTWGAI